MESCSSCAKPGASLRCGRCRAAVYCGQQCQAADWKSGHRFTCRPAATAAPAQHEVEVREAIAKAHEEEGAEEEPEVRTDADQLGAQIRAVPLRRHDAEVKEATERVAAAAAELRRAVPQPSEGAAPSRAEHRAASEASSSSEDEEPRLASSEDDEAGVEKVEKFKLDPDFDYDNVTLSKPEWPYNLRPRPPGPSGPS
mmetsp:Transcript_143965/g.460791  ORF Transcript_143965/g.460791 Transcript_143965/m.460791 type:complete len:198 (+) Transcript_143965:67-660(+)